MGKPIKTDNRWRIRWTDERGKRRSQNFETYKDALFELRQRENEVAEIKRGVRSQRIPDRSFSDLCDYWIEKRASQKRSGFADESILRQLRPAFGNLMIRDIGIAQIDEYKLKRVHLDRQTINNHLKLLISMLNLAVDLKWLTEKPKIKKYKVPKYSTDYRYLRTDDEIKRFLLSARNESEYVFVLYATALYTGMRLGELAGLTKASVDFQKRFIMVQRSFDGPTKNEGIRFIPILDPLLPILQNWFVKCPGVLVFPNEAGNMHQCSARVFQETLHRVLTSAQFPRVTIKGKTKWYIRFHDLRHTFASHWMMKGGDLFRLQKILGHGSTEMTMRYAHLAPEIFASDYGRFGKEAPTTGNGMVFQIDNKR